MRNNSGVIPIVVCVVIAVIQIVFVFVRRRSAEPERDYPPTRYEYRRERIAGRHR